MKVSSIKNFSMLDTDSEFRKVKIASTLDTHQSQYSRRQQPKRVNTIQRYLGSSVENKSSCIHTPRQNSVIGGSEYQSSIDPRDYP